MLKKKLVASILCLGLTAGIFSYSIDVQYLNNKCFASNQGLIGDLNGDNYIDNSDCMLMGRYLLRSINHFPVADDLWSGDLDGNGVINSVDYSLLKRYTLNRINKFPKTPAPTPTPMPTLTPTPIPTPTPTPTTWPINDRYFPSGTSKSELISKAGNLKVSESKALIKMQVDEHWAVLQSICGFKDKNWAYAFFFGMATRESTFRAATETGSESAHAFGLIQTAETAYNNANPKYMPEKDVPEMVQYDFTDEAFYDVGMSMHMGIRHLLHFARLAQAAGYSGKDILRHALMGFNTGWVDGSSEDWIRSYADQTAAFAEWYYNNNHMSDNEFTWDGDSRVDRSNPWSWY